MPPFEVWGIGKARLFFLFPFSGSMTPDPPTRQPPGQERLSNGSYKASYGR